MGRDVCRTLRRPPLLQRGGGVGRYHYGSNIHANPMILYARLASNRRTPTRVRTWRILVGAAVQLGPWSPLSCTEYGCGDGRNGADYQLCWARSACWTSPSRAFRQAPERWRQAELAAHVRRTRSAPLGKPDSRELKARQQQAQKASRWRHLSRCRSGFRESGSSV
jgi:hypothetical protein